MDYPLPHLGQDCDSLDPSSVTKIHHNSLSTRPRDQYHTMPCSSTPCAGSSQGGSLCVLTVLLSNLASTPSDINRLAHCIAFVAVPKLILLIMLVAHVLLCMAVIVSSVLQLWHCLDVEVWVTAVSSTIRDLCPSFFTLNFSIKLSGTAPRKRFGSSSGQGESSVKGNLTMEFR